MSKAVFAEFGCPKCGGDVYDNRENKRNPKAPNFKCKDCGWVQWPEKKGEFQKAKSAMAEDVHADKNGRAVRHEAQPAARPDYLDARQKAIIRQHAHNAALELLKIKQAAGGLEIEELNPSKLRQLSDWFYSDVLNMFEE